MRPPRRMRRVLLGLVVAAFVLNQAPTLLERFGADVRPVDINGQAPQVLLASLTVSVEDPAGYAREAFGAGWVTGPDGCTTRQRVLAYEAVTVTVAADGCTVAAGEWLSAWDGIRVTDPAALDVDHLVPLAEAWASGAAGWPAEDRQAYANDLEHPDALVAVTAESNRAKGDADPAEWLPSDPAVHCRYTAAWIAQKAAWGLSVDPAERQALAELLASCAPQGAGA